MEAQQRRIEEEGLTRGKQQILVDGRKMVIGYHATPVVKDGRLTGYRVAFRDISPQVELERKQEELRLELLEKSRLASLGNLLQGVAHNLNNPITIMQSTLEWIRTAAPEEVNLGEELGVLADQVRRIREMVANMLEKGRREALHQVTRLDLNTVLREELKFLQANPFFKHEVKLETQLLPLPPILGIYSDFSQSFGNLLNNALDAMFDSPVKQLKVSTACRQSDLLIEFQDTGLGIPPEALPHIFDPFFSTKPNVSVDGRPAGSGLGLHACRMLLDPYGVKFEVESRPGAGATFRLRVPIQPARTVRVLLVEDDPDFRLGLHAGLRAFNIAVTAAASAEEALKLEDRFDAYLVNVMLPGMSGFDYVAELRSGQPEAKVIFLTAAEPVQVEARAKALKVNLVLYKPVTFRELAQAIALLDMPGSPVAAGW
jgi:signal transduction histidine kinase